MIRRPHSSPFPERESPPPTAAAPPAAPPVEIPSLPDPKDHPIYRTSAEIHKMAWWLIPLLLLAVYLLLKDL